MNLSDTLRGWTNKLPGFRQAREAEELSEAQTDMPIRPGQQQDALRHALWTARMGQDYGRVPAVIASNAKEALSAGMNLFERNPAERQRVNDETLMDVKNNLYGSKFGADNPNLTPQALVAALRRAPLEAMPPR